MRALLPAAMLLCLAAGTAWAEPRGSVRTGTEGARGRVVFDWTERVAHSATRDGDRIRLRFGDGRIPDLAGARRLPRNVLAVAQDGDAVVLTLAPGARSSIFVLGNRVVVDATDAPPGAASAAPQAVPPVRARPAIPARADAPAAQRMPERATVSPGQGDPARVQPSVPARRDVPGARHASGQQQPGAPPVAQPRAEPAAPARAMTPTTRAAERQRRRRGDMPESQAAAEAAALAAALAAAARSVSEPASGGPPPGVPPVAPTAAPAGARAPAAQPVSPEPPAPTAAAIVALPAPAVANVVQAEEQVPVQAVAGLPEAAPRAASAPSPVPAPAPPRGGTAPRPPVARIVPGAAGPALLVTAEAETGAAVLRRGNAILLVLDSAAAPDVTALAADPLFRDATAEAFPGGTLLRLPLPPPARLAARRTVQGWLFELERSGVETPPARPIVVAVEDGPPPRIVLRATRPGRVVAIADPETGAPLLVATLRDAGQAVGLPRGVPEARLLPTMLGAAVLARSDHVVLRALPDRIVLQGSAQAPLQVGGVTGTMAPEEPAALRRTMDLPGMDRAGLLDRLRTQQAAIAEAPPLGRAAARRDAAEAMLALGLAQEAQSMAALALREDPRAREEARLLLVHGAASVAAGRPAEAGPLDDARLADDEEAALWRALRRVAQGGMAEAGPAIATAVPLLLAYPEDLRARLLPAAAEGLTEAGEWPAIRRLAEAAPNVPALALARARMAEEEGRVEEALAEYAAIGAGPDRLARARALRRAVELRLARGLIDAAAAAAALDALLYAWRGDADELRARLRVAELQRIARAPRQAFALLDETARLFPDQAGAVRALMADTLGEAIATETPLAAVTLHEAHGALLSGAAAERAARTLAERLIALDLTEQAGRLLHDAMARATEPNARASLGARLAALRLGEGEAAEALDALAASEGEGLEAGLVEERNLLAARALAARGDTERAAAMLDGLGATGATTLAELRAGQRDWSGAAAALGRQVDAELADGAGPLTAGQQRMIAQQAAWLALAGDAAALGALRARHGARMEEGPLADSFALMTAEPMRGIADLPRLTRELETLRALPARLEALRSGGGMTR